MIHGKPVTREQLQKEVAAQKAFLEMAGITKTPIIAAVSENPDGDGDHIASMLLAGLVALKESDDKKGKR